MTRKFELGHRNILLELDSQLVVHCILPKVAPQWSIITQIGCLQHLITHANNFKFIHVFREENCVAYALSKHSHNTATPHVYFKNHQLPKEEMAYYQLDLLEMPNFRTKKTEKIFEPP